MSSPSTPSSSSRGCNPTLAPGSTGLASSAVAALGQAGTRPCLGSADRAGWVRALPKTWSADTTCTAGLPSLVRAGFTLFRLRGFAIALGDAKSWYQGLCAAVGLRPVSCNENHGTQYREYNAGTLPQTPCSCQLGAYITAQSGWQHTIPFCQGAEMRVMGRAWPPAVSVPSAGSATRSARITADKERHGDLDELVQGRG